MANHAPDHYVCPICAGLNGNNDNSLIRDIDFVYRDDEVAVIVGSFGFGKHPGHILVTPIHHHENIFDIPNNMFEKVNAHGCRVATALKKAVGCEGITFMQNNEPAGSQHALHFHLNVFPRYEDDNLLNEFTNRQYPSIEWRAQFAKTVAEIYESVTSAPTNSP